MISFCRKRTFVEFNTQQMLGLGLRIEGKNICAMKPHSTSVMVKVFGKKQWNYTILKLRLKIKKKKKKNAFT
jgi:hypothetical protein